MLALCLANALGVQQPALLAQWTDTQSPHDSVAPHWVAVYPERARDSIRIWMATSVSAPPRAAGVLLAKAERLGVDYLKVWGDSFPLNDARRFESWPLPDREKRVRADSLRKVGNAALGREGFGAAELRWRASFQLAAEIGDTATMAAAVGNIGTGFYREAELDSAARYYSEANYLAVVASDRRTALNAIGGLASVSKDRGNYEAATARYREALALRREIGDYRGVAADANNLGLIASTTGNAVEARRRHLEALVTAREHGFDDAAAAALLNLGTLAASGGDDHSADKLYRQALALDRKLGDAAAEALVLRDMALLEAHAGNYPLAVDRYRSALAILERAGPPQTTIGVRLDLSQVLAAMGALDHADRELSAAEELARRAGLGPAVDGRLRIARGDLAAQFNHVASARDFYERGAALLRKAKDRAGEGDVLAALGSLSLTEEDAVTAGRFLAAATRLQQAVGDGRSAALTALLAARAAREVGDTAIAQRLIAAAVDTLHAAGDRVAEAWARCESGDLERAMGATGAAEASYRAGLEQLGRTPSTDIAVCLYGGLGRTLRTRGMARAAVAELERGVAAIEAAAADVAGPGRRADFLSDKWDLYAELALAQRLLGADSTAFETSERLRAQQTLALLTARPATTSPEVMEPRLAALRRRITELMDPSAVLEAAVALRGPGALDSLPDRRRAGLARTEAEYSELLDSFDLKHATSAPRVPAGPGWREIAARLSKDQALIEYLVTDSAAVAFVVTRNRLAAVTLPVSGAELATEVDFLRGMLRPESTGAVQGWRAPLRTLHRQLVAPLEAAALLEHVHRLVIVPHRELHYVPFAALLEAAPSGRFLVQRYELGVVSSAAVWLRLGARATGAAATRLLALAPRERDLPGAGAEVRAIAQLYGRDADLLLGDRATSQAFATAAPGHAIIHLASLGLLNKHNPQFSYVALAAHNGLDGRLEVHEIARLSLDARLIVLSACQTGLGSGRLADVPPGDDWVGLVQAFQSAGARAVLGTLWPIDDQATARLMRRFYAELRAGATVSAALAVAQRSTLSMPGFQAPFYWAGFVLDGAF
jgi:CHAT domain-containing protein/tetratricopeptide (TPR) repeat protein